MTPPDRPSLLMFWDYDTQWGADRSRSGGGPGNWGALEFDNTEQLLGIHDAFDVRACFAVVGAAALAGPRPYHDPDQIRRIAAAGHELASHSFRHDWIPGLCPEELRTTLRASREAIEACAQVSVTSFVPPYNQPFDYPAGGAISISERLTARRCRTDLSGLCRALRETGYRFCRVAYLPVLARLKQRLTGAPRRPVRPERIEGISCLRLSVCGFDRRAMDAIEQARPGDHVVVYGHPHSLHSGNSQDLAFLTPFLKKVNAMRSAGRLRILCPRDLAQQAAAA